MQMVLHATRLVKAKSDRATYCRIPAPSDCSLLSAVQPARQDLDVRDWFRKCLRLQLGRGAAVILSLQQGDILHCYNKTSMSVSDKRCHGMSVPNAVGSVT